MMNLRILLDECLQIATATTREGEYMATVEVDAVALATALLVVMEDPTPFQQRHTLYFAGHTDPR